MADFQYELTATELPPQTELGKMVKAFRKRRRLTQAQLAVYSGVAINCISRIESGHYWFVREATIRKIARDGFKMDARWQGRLLHAGGDDVSYRGVTEESEQPPPLRLLAAR